MVWAIKGKIAITFRGLVMDNEWRLYSIGVVDVFDKTVDFVGLSGAVSLIGMNKCLDKVFFKAMFLRDESEFSLESFHEVRDIRSSLVLDFEWSPFLRSDVGVGGHGIEILLSPAGSGSVADSSNEEGFLGNGRRLTGILDASQGRGKAEARQSVRDRELRP